MSAPPKDRKAVVVGISGASSSGKTTLARLLRDVLPNTFILHEDDFYKPEEQQVPLRNPLIQLAYLTMVGILQTSHESGLPGLGLRRRHLTSRHGQGAPAHPRQRHLSRE
jgi:energy-coupling factor transporter ATP-binding protein EcfA2